VAELAVPEEGADNHERGEAKDQGQRDVEGLGVVVDGPRLGRVLGLPLQVDGRARQPLRRLAVGGQGDDADRDVGGADAAVGEEVLVEAPLVVAPAGVDLFRAEGFVFAVVRGRVRDGGFVGVVDAVDLEGGVGGREEGRVPGYCWGVWLARAEENGRAGEGILWCVDQTQ
jgi:hypothetical protein